MLGMMSFRPIALSFFGVLDGEEMVRSYKHCADNWTLTTEAIWDEKDFLHSSAF